MFDTGSIKRDFGGAALQYDEEAKLQRVVRKHLFKLAAPCWPKDARLLDLGCGTGIFAKEAATKKWQIMNLDLALGMCKEAVKKSPTVNANAENLPFDDASFDGVFSSLMLQWANNPVGVYKEIARVLESGGCMAMATLVEGTLYELESSFKKIDDTPHVNNFPPSHLLLEYAKQAGLSLMSAKQMPLIEHYPDVVALMRSLQAIGAGNKHISRNRGLMTPKKLSKLEQYYRVQYSEPEGLRVSWQVLFLMLRKE